jgi:hypothetical protein
MNKGQSLATVGATERINDELVHYIKPFELLNGFFEKGQQEEHSGVLKLNITI